MIQTHTVLLPGTLCDERLFKDITALFQSSEILDLRHSDTLADMRKVVEGVSTERFNLIGFSMGGHVAQEFTIAHPQRVERLIVMGSSSEGYPVEEKKIVLSSLSLVERSKFTGITHHRLREYLHPSAFENAGLRELIQSMAGPDAKEVYLRQIKATLERQELKSQMKDLRTPMLYIAGSDDRIVPLQSIQRSAENANARLAVISECGHFIPLEKPGETRQVIQEFLA